MLWIQQLKKPDVEASGQGRAAEGGAPYQARGEMGQLAAAIPNELASENFACPEHGAVMEELSPRLFSFNSLWCLSSLSWIGTLRM